MDLRHVCSALMLCGVALLWSATANAQFEQRKKETKNFYVVREAGSDQCTIKPGKWGDNPAGMVGNGPYASKDYANAAIKTFPECKGTKSDKTPKPDKTKKKQKTE
jgi:hypothetical protein